MYDFLFHLKVYPPGCLLDNPINAVTTKFVRTSTNKLRCPIFCVAVSKIMFTCLSEELQLGQPTTNAFVFEIHVNNKYCDQIIIDQ